MTLDKSHCDMVKIVEVVQGVGVSGTWKYPSSTTLLPGVPPGPGTTGPLLGVVGIFEITDEQLKPLFKYVVNIQAYKSYTSQLTYKLQPFFSYQLENASSSAALFWCAACYINVKLLEYPEAVRACAMRRYPRNLGIFLILIVFWAVRPILSFSHFVL